MSYRVVSRFHDDEGNATYVRHDEDNGQGMVDHFRPEGREIIMEGSIEEALDEFGVRCEDFIDDTQREKLEVFMIEIGYGDVEPTPPQEETWNPQEPTPFVQEPVAPPTNEPPADLHVNADGQFVMGAPDVPHDTVPTGPVDESQNVVEDVTIPEAVATGNSDTAAGDPEVTSDEDVAVDTAPVDETPVVEAPADEVISPVEVGNQEVTPADEAHANGPDAPLEEPAGPSSEQE